MGWEQNSIFQLLIVDAGQPNSGLFVYNGTGAPGNPPVCSIVAPGTTTDPYGNPVTSSKILIQGNVITESGGIFRTAAAAPLIQLDGPHNTFLIYDAAAVLRETIAPVLTSDGLGNTVQAGFTAYATGLFTQLTAAVLQWGGTGITVSPTIGSGATAFLQIACGQTAANTVQSIMSLNPVAVGGIPNMLINSNIDITTAGAGLQVKEGSNAKQGTATLAGGTNVVFNTSVTAISRIYLTAQDNNSTGALRVSARTAGTSFTITSSNAADSGVVAYEIFEPG